MSDNARQCRGCERRRTTRRNGVTRRGGTYITVMITAMIVTVIGLGSLFVVRVHSRTLDLQADAAEARQYALSAVEVGQWYIKSGSTWRTSRPNGVWASNITLGSGTYSLEVFDPEDGDIANWAGDPVVVRGTGRRGMARQMMQVTLDPAPEPMDYLRTAIHTGGEFYVASGRTLRVGGAIVSTNGRLRNDGTIDGDVEAGMVTTAGVISGTLTSPSPSKAMPASNVVDQYVARGTVISPGSTMEGVVLGPGVNPFGEVNSEGVYVISSSSDVTIRNCRIVGTLVVLLDSDRRLRIEEAVHFEPAREDFPVLIVRGNLSLNHAGGTEELSEEEVGVNFNPVGAPYRGVTDTDMDDVYPSEIVGLVHATGKLELLSDGRVRGLIIAESSAASKAVDVNDNFEVEYDARLHANPPIGYGTSAMSVRPGSWVRIVD